VQVGLGRVISDLATFAYLADVFIAEEYQRHGQGKWLIDCAPGYPELQGLRYWMLVTKDAQGLYGPYGFTPLSNPESIMEIINQEV
jgi:GNAT superfamily N-acetyltransferase